VNHTEIIKDQTSNIDERESIIIEDCSFCWKSGEKENKKEDKKEDKKEGKKKNSKGKLSKIVEGIDREALLPPSTINEKTESNINITTDSQVNISSEEIKITLENINLSVTKGEMIAIIGDVGSGKSSLFEAILNNMSITRNSQNSKIKVNGSISYVAQVPWIQNDTIKNNILFLSELDERKYDEILKISQLTHDLEQLEGKDLTEIGEKGINLSGGQKARVAIARSIYAEKDIYMFDDILSALDGHVGKKIFDRVICQYLISKTRLVITHALQYISHFDRILFMESGRIIWEGKYDDLVNQPFFEGYKTKVLKMMIERQKSQVEERTDTDDTDIIKNDPK
jgi:ABC-type transport system involved in cytochrome bd biosynthesis fused ATPase/permease subunit